MAYSNIHRRLKYATWNIKNEILIDFRFIKWQNVHQLLRIRKNILIDFLSSVNSESFSFPDPISFGPPCGDGLLDSVGRWSTHGEVTLTADDINVYNSILTVQAVGQDVVKHVCDIDLTACPPPSNVTHGINMCICNNHHGNRYRVVIRQRPHVNVSNLVLQIMLHSADIFNPVYIAAKIGKLPWIYETRNICSSSHTMITATKETATPATVTTKTTSTTTTTTTVLPIVRTNVTTCDQASDPPPLQLMTLTNVSGIGGEMDVLCDTQTDGGGWVVIQRRMSNTVDFNRNWNNYTQGFGDLESNFWLGLDKIHLLCNEGQQCEFRVDLYYDGPFSSNQVHQNSNHTYFATYDTFSISGSEDFYRLNISGYQGTAGDAIISTGNDAADQNGMQFSTFDEDHDTANYNCAESFGGWWWKACGWARLNDVWGVKGRYGPLWMPLTDYFNSVSFSEIKVRQKH